MVEVVENGFDIHIGDIICQQDNLITENFPCVFAFQVFGFNQAGLQETSDESACAREWVEDVHIFLCEGGVELFA